MHTIATLTSDLRALGVHPGDTLMVHASLRRIGPVEGGADGLIDALEAAVSERGTLMMVLGSHDDGALFDPLRTPPSHEVGALAGVFLRRPGTLVTDNPEGRFAARGHDAAALLGEQPWHDYFGPGSPLERLVERDGRVLRLGADDETTTLMHYAEYLAPLPAKRRVARERLVQGPSGPERRVITCLDDEHGIVDWSGEDYFADCLRAYRATGRMRQGRVGDALAELLEARDVLRFSVDWMGANLGS